jgi:methionine-rich copper-binding protein CopC
MAPAAVLAATLLLPQLALAHAVLVDSTPKANETVHGSSLHIDLKFNSRVDGARSTVQLAAGDGSVRTLELSTQTSPNEIVTHAEDLTKGSYTLRWQALASDGHITRGQIPFQVE